MFSDEVSFELADTSAVNRSFVHRTQTEKYSSACILDNPVQSRQRLMAWGCITRTGPGPFCIVRGGITSDTYQRVLNDNLLPFLGDLPLSKRVNTIFQQDNAPPHRARATRDFLQQAAIPVTDWPPLSPDLNPIENVWALLKRRIRKIRPQTIRELETAILDSWSAVVTRKLCKRLFLSMPDRISKVIKLRGLRP